MQHDYWTNLSHTVRRRDRAERRWTTDIAREPLDPARKQADDESISSRVPSRDVLRNKSNQQQITLTNHKFYILPLARTIFLPCDFISRSVFNNGSFVVALTKKKDFVNKTNKQIERKFLPRAEMRYLWRDSRSCLCHELSFSDLVDRCLSKYIFFCFATILKITMTRDCFATQIKWENYNCNERYHRFLKKRKYKFN